MEQKIALFDSRNAFIRLYSYSYLVHVAGRRNTSIIMHAVAVKVLSHIALQRVLVSSGKLCAYIITINQQLSPFPFRLTQNGTVPITKEPTVQLVMLGDGALLVSSLDASSQPPY